MEERGCVESWAAAEESEAKSRESGVGEMDLFSLSITRRVPPTPAPRAHHPRDKRDRYSMTGGF